MQKTISAMKARQNLGQIMNEVSLRGDDFIIERAGKPVAVLVSMDKYQIILKDRQAARQAVNQIREKMKSEDSERVELIISEAIEKTKK
jgi:prevent-host-death family protein